MRRSRSIILFCSAGVAKTRSIVIGVLQERVGLERWNCINQACFLMNVNNSTTWFQAMGFAPGTATDRQAGQMRYGVNCYGRTNRHISLQIE